MEGRAQTPDRILDASELLFAEHGYAATSVRDITTRAHCNVAAVNYHFGGKDKLYREMFRRRLEALRERRIGMIRAARTEAAPGSGLEDFLRSFARGFIEPLVHQNGAPERHDESVTFTLLARELVDRHLPHEFIRGVLDPVVEAWAEALEHLCPGIGRESARLSFHLMVGQLVHVVHLHRHFGPTAPGPLPEVLDQIVRHASAGIRACAVSPSPGWQPGAAP